MILQFIKLTIVLHSLNPRFFCVHGDDRSYHRAGMARQTRDSGLPHSKAKSATPLPSLSLMMSTSSARLFSLPKCISSKRDTKHLHKRRQHAKMASDEGNWGPAILALTIAFLVLVLIFLFLRIFTRVWIVHQFWYDDAAIILAVVSASERYLPPAC